MIWFLMGPTILGSLIGGAIGLGASLALTIVIDGIIDKMKIEKEMSIRGLNKMVIESKNTCTNVIKVKALDTDQEIQISGDSISDEIKEGQIISL